jgi:hypothetical protein
MSNTLVRRASPQPGRGRHVARGADELIVTTITHDHADQVRSYELLAQEWDTR